jgi:hypothetical protein
LGVWHCGDVSAVVVEGVAAGLGVLCLLFAVAVVVVVVVAIVAAVAAAVFAGLGEVEVGVVEVAI